MNHFLYKLCLVSLLVTFINTTLFAQPACLGEKGKAQWLLYEKHNGSQYINPVYPQSPSGSEVIRSLETAANYNDYYASLIKGFIVVPETGKYIFNITGKDVAQFFLSSNGDPANLSLFVEASGANYAQHDKKPEQTDSLNLIAGQYYYFEIHHVEGGGSDLLRVSWRTPFANTEWQTIGEDYFYGYDDSCNNFCPEKGTPCDDGNATTSNDQEDGACNCIGIPDNLPNCAGERGVLQALYYDNIPGKNVSDLENAAAYPLQPSRSELLSAIYKPSVKQVDSFGTVVKAILQVPVTGDYEWQVSADDRADLYFSLTTDPNDATLVANSSGTTSMQSLTAGQFYYIELRHKENTGKELFTVLWKTPFQLDDNFKIINSLYLYRYECELACVPEGTPCDDGDPDTINDTYDANCTCVGIDCPNGDCPEFTNFPPYDACAPTEKHSTNASDAWLSCQASANPNSARGNTHWIRYDLGSVMPIGTSHIWNYNVAGQTGKGFKQVAIDLSIDGTNWEEFGMYEWAQAPGSSIYEGFEGPDFTGKSARYVLISGLSNWNGNSCSGFSEMKFKAAMCPDAGTPCDDRNPFTSNDLFDANCVCNGPAIIVNNCTDDILTINNITISSSEGFHAAQTITSNAVIEYKNHNKVLYVAGTSISLQPGFQVNAGVDFLATINACNTTILKEPEEVVTYRESDEAENTNEEAAIIKTAAITSKASLQLMPNPTRNWTTIAFDLSHPTKIYLDVFDNAGRLVIPLANHQYYEAGRHQKLFPAHNIAKGMYFVRLRTEQEVLTKRLIVID